jgi:ribosomal protein S3AE
VEHKYRSYPVKLSTFDGYTNEQIESLVTVQTSDEDIFSTRVTVDQISAGQRKIRKDMNTFVANHDTFCNACVADSQ